MKNSTLWKIASAFAFIIGFMRLYQTESVDIAANHQILGAMLYICARVTDIVENGR